MKKVKLILEYDMGVYNDEDIFSTDPEDIGWQESFYQSDAIIHDMKIVDLKIEDAKND